MEIGNPFGIDCMWQQGPTIFETRGVKRAYEGRTCVRCEVLKSRRKGYTLSSRYNFRLPGGEEASVPTRPTPARILDRIEGGGR